MIESDRRIYEILQYLNKSNVRFNSNLTEDVLRSQFEFTNYDYKEAFNKIIEFGLIYRRENNCIAISHDGEIKFNELNSTISMETNQSALIPVKVVFISYSWDSESHKDWVLNLANSLIEHGIDVLLDQYDLSAGKEMTHFMEKAMTADKVLTVLTPNYKLKADKREGGVGYEYSLLSKEFCDNEPDQTRIIPILRSADEKTSCPAFIKTKIFHDMRDENKFDSRFFELIKLILDKPLVKKPELGQLPNFDDTSTPEIEKTILDFKKREELLKRRKSIINSTNGTEIFIANIENIIKQISDTLENYTKNFEFHFSVKKSNQPRSIIFTTVNFTFGFVAHNQVINSASEAYVKLNLYKGPVGFDEYGFDYWEQPEKIYNTRYNFDLDEDLNPIFIKSDDQSIRLTAHDIAILALRDLITHEIKYRESQLE